MSHDATEAVTMKKGTYVKLSTASIPLPTVSTCTDPDRHGKRKNSVVWRGAVKEGYFVYNTPPETIVSPLPGVLCTTADVSHKNC